MATIGIITSVETFDPLDTVVSLTTIFTPPSSCRTHWTYEASFYNSVSGGLLLQNALPSPLDAACFPPSYTNYGRSSLSQIYSPGHCPVGYATPAQYVNGPTTTLICCQSSFTYFTTITTIDNFSPASALIFAGCISTYDESSGATTVPARINNTDLLPSTTVTGPVIMWGQPIEVAFRQQDLSLYTTSTSSTTSSASAQPSSKPVTQPAATTTPLPQSTSPTSSPSNSDNLSKGARAGIGLGAVVIGLSLLGFTLFLLWRRRRRAGSEKPGLAGAFGGSKEKEKEMPWHEEPKRRPQLAEIECPTPELDANTQIELLDPYSAPVAEMESKEHLPPKPPAK